MATLGLIEYADASPEVRAVYDDIITTRKTDWINNFWKALANDPATLSPAASADSSVCVWDLRLQAFEREAWIKHVLRKPDAPDFDGYLAERLTERT